MSDTKRTLEIDVRQESLKKTQAVLQGIAQAAAAANQQLTLMQKSASGMPIGGIRGPGGPGTTSAARPSCSVQPVLLTEIGGKASRELAGAVMSGMLAASRVMARAGEGEGGGGGGGGGGGSGGKKGLWGLTRPLLGRFATAGFGMAAAAAIGHGASWWLTHGTNRYGEHTNQRLLEDFQDAVAGKDPTGLTRLGLLGTRRDLERGNVGSAQQMLSVNAAKAAARAQRDQRLDMLRDQEALARAQARFGLSSQGAQFGINVAGTRWIEAAQNAAAAGGPYDRVALQADLARRGQLGIALGSQQAEAGRQRAILDAQRQRALARESGLGGQMAASDANVAILKKQAGNRNLTDLQFLERSLKLSQGLAENEQIRAQLEQARQQRLQLEQQYLQQTLQAGQQRVALLQQEHGALSQIVQQERQRLQSSKEAYGLMRPTHQAATLQVARKLSAGQQLTQAELEFARSHSDLFGSRLHRLGAATADRAGFGELTRLLPELTERARQAEQQRIKLEQDIRVQIQLNEKAVAAQLEKQVVPVIHTMMGDLENRLKAALLKIMNEFRRNQAAGLGG